MAITSVCIKGLYQCVARREGYNEKTTINSGLYSKWWSRGGSNPRPSHCERDALPSELRPQQGCDSSLRGCLSLVREYIRVAIFVFEEY